jgi:hypothetical protein
MQRGFGRARVRTQACGWADYPREMWSRAVLGVALCLVGGVFFGQGIGAIHGSVMTGETQWAVIGGVMFALGLALLLWARRLAR